MESALVENAQAMFQSVLRDQVAPVLRAHGWKGSGREYKRASDLYRAFINFQKSVHNTKDEVEFTVNLGVLNDDAIAERSAAWGEAIEQWGRDVIAIPTWGSWVTRIGFLLPTRRDKWWRLVTGKSPEKIATEVVNALTDYALPAVEQQMNKPRVEPGFVIERRGRLCGSNILANGDIRWHNVGGGRIYPTDALLDAVDREYSPVPVVWKPLSPIPVDFRSTQPDGCLSLEGESTRRHLAEEGVRLTEGTPLLLSQWWMDSDGRKFLFSLAGEARHDDAWGWGAEVSPKSLREYLDAAAKNGYKPAPS